ncbi:ribbon-helix-helix protein, CopG family [Methanobacterium subterraneum]|nr:ribbon-helix-helix protein, CopG family [Methanobacterium subterraneum]
MMVAKCVSMDLEDLTEIQEKIKKGESNSVSEFVRNAIRKELKR